MKKVFFAIAVVSCAALALSACCSSLTCQVKQAAEEELGCDGGDLAITNLTRHEPGTGNLAHRLADLRGFNQAVRLLTFPQLRVDLHHGIGNGVQNFLQLRPLGGKDLAGVDGVRRPAGDARRIREALVIPGGDVEFDEFLP